MDFLICFCLLWSAGAEGRIESACETNKTTPSGGSGSIRKLYLVLQLYLVLFKLFQHQLCFSLWGKTSFSYSQSHPVSTTKRNKEAEPVWTAHIQFHQPGRTCLSWSHVVSTTSKNHMDFHICFCLLWSAGAEGRIESACETNKTTASGGSGSIRKLYLVLQLYLVLCKLFQHQLLCFLVWGKTSLN